MSTFLWKWAHTIAWNEDNSLDKPRDKKYAVFCELNTSHQISYLQQSCPERGGAGPQHWDETLYFSNESFMYNSVYICVYCMNMFTRLSMCFSVGYMCVCFCVKAFDNLVCAKIIPAKYPLSVQAPIVVSMFDVWVLYE